MQTKESGPNSETGKFLRVDQTRISYTLTARVEGTKHFLVENLSHTHKLTVLIADICNPL
jgi:hypothetical protein